MNKRSAKCLLAAGLFSLCLGSCQTEDTGPAEGVPPENGGGDAHFQTLLFNPAWYRTFDSSSNTYSASGNLVFSWSFGDTTDHPDSFYVGIDTLWTLPLRVGGDTTPQGSWDLQLCVDRFCVEGLAAGVHGANAFYHFGEPTDPIYETEHHLIFWPAMNAVYIPLAPPQSLFGALMFARSRSTGRADTVLAFGAWHLAWDSTHPPPVRPVNGYLPKKSDFEIVGDSIVRYVGP